MNQKFIISIVVIVLILVGILVSSNKKDKMNLEESTENTESVMKENATAEKVEEGSITKKDEMMKSGSYEIYDMAKLSKAETGDVVLFFRASWCPTCRGLDKDIKENLSKIPEGLTILDVNYDNSNELKKKYGVTYQHTLVQVDKDGNLIKKWQGSPTLSALASEVQ